MDKQNVVRLIDAAQLARAALRRARCRGIGVRMEQATTAVERLPDGGPGDIVARGTKARRCAAARGKAA
jgi:hypothetical protein